MNLLILEIDKIKKKAIAISGLTEGAISESQEDEQAPWCYSDKDWKKYMAWVREKQNPKLVSTKVVGFARKAKIKVNK